MAGAAESETLVVIWSEAVGVGGGVPTRVSFVGGGIVVSGA